jgi:hypothetical protein
MLICTVSGMPGVNVVGFMVTAMTVVTPSVWEGKKKKETRPRITT